MPTRLADARRWFAALPVANGATVRPDGSPHVVPLWFVWEDDLIYISLRRDSATWRNVESDRRVAVSFNLGARWQELMGITLSGRAEPMAADHPSVGRVMSAWFEKYRPLLAGGGFRSYSEDVEAPGMLRFRAERMGAWNHAR